MKCTVKVVEQSTTIDTTGQAAAIDSAEAKGAKKITVKFNKALEAVPAKDKVTVSRANTKKTVDSVAFTDDTKTSIDIIVSTALTKGNYDVSVEGVNAEALKAEVVVAEDETLTSYEVSPQLISKSKDAVPPNATTIYADWGYVYYRALNQYNEPMNANQPQVSSTFSSDTSVKTVASATEWGKIEVGSAANPINAFLKIPGSKGTIVLVDGNKGVSKTAEIEYARSAAPTEMTFEGVYNTLTSKMIGQELPSRQDASNFYLLYTGKTQYECVGVDKEILEENGATTANVAGGITNISEAAAGAQWVDIKVDGKQYVALKLRGTNIKAGTATVTIVNNTVGSLASHTVNVKDTVLVESFTISTSSIYEKQKNEIAFQAIDTEGKSVTDFATLNSLVVPMNVGGGTGARLYFERQNDGTAKLIYDLENVPNTVTGADERANTLISAAVRLNDYSSINNYKVQTYNFTLNKERFIKSVLRVDGDKAFTVRTNSTGELKIKLGDFVFADQYGNEVKDDDIKTGLYKEVNSLVLGNTAVAVKPNPANEVSVLFVGNGVTGKLGTGADANKMVFSAAVPGQAGSATVYVKYDAAGSVSAQNDDYDYKFVVNAYESEQADQTGLTITKVNDDNYGDYRGVANGVTVDPVVVVKAKIAGEDVEIPASQYKIIGLENASFTADDDNKGIDTKTATVIVRATTWDADHNETTTDLKKEYTISKAAAYTFKVDDVNENVTIDARIGALDANNVARTSTNITKDDLAQLFVFKDQYGNVITDTDRVAYDITVKAKDTDTYSCVANGSNAVVLENKSMTGTVAVSVKASVGGTSDTVDATIQY